MESRPPLVYAHPMDKRIKDQITALLQRPLHRSTPLQGGCIAEVYQLELDQGESVVAKVDTSSKPDLATEGDMLTFLDEHSQLPVPKVIHSSPELLVMQHLPGDSHFSNKAQAHAAELLAALHAVHGESFGFHWDTRIGALHQPNPQESSWCTFFREHRIRHMADAALQEGRMPRDLHRRLMQFCEKLDDLIEEPPAPSLIHGDVWTTNVLVQGNKITGFIDPAIYFAHPEIELAFTTLFGTFGDAFFQRYHEITPISAGFFDVRRDIYNLYPLLVHVRLFGAGYLGGIEKCIQRHGY